MTKKPTMIAWKIYINWYRNIADFLKLPRLSNEKFKKRVELHGLENLREALKKEKVQCFFLRIWVILNGPAAGLRLKDLK